MVGSLISYLEGKSMRNMYLYGASDDCREIETDFGLDCESHEDIIIFHSTGAVIAHYVYVDGDWGVQIIGDPPLNWIVKAIEANAPVGFRGYADAGQFIHIQIPDDETIKLTPMRNDNGRETYNQTYASMQDMEKN
jgi:hypothetical protein